MIVFKTILKILNKLKGMLILYTFMLVMITFINQTSNNETSFLESKPSIAIVNEDDSLITNDFIDYMDKHCIIKNLAPKNIDDALFYRSINMVVYIPKDFGENLLSNNVTLEYKASCDEPIIESNMTSNMLFPKSTLSTNNKNNKRIDKPSKLTI